MIALYHKDATAECCWLRPEEKLDELLSIAKPGDSLHKIADNIPPHDAIPFVRLQRERKEGKQL